MPIYKSRLVSIQLPAGVTTYDYEINPIGNCISCIGTTIDQSNSPIPCAGHINGSTNVSQFLIYFSCSEDCLQSSGLEITISYTLNGLTCSSTETISSLCDIAQPPSCTCTVIPSSDDFIINEITSLQDDPNYWGTMFGILPVDACGSPINYFKLEIGGTTSSSFYWVSITSEDVDNNFGNQGITLSIDEYYVANQNTQNIPKSVNIFNIPSSIGSITLTITYVNGCTSTYTIPQPSELSQIFCGQEISDHCYQNNNGEYLTNGVSGGSKCFLFEPPANIVKAYIDFDTMTEPDRLIVKDSSGTIVADTGYIGECGSNLCNGISINNIDPRNGLTCTNGPIIIKGTDIMDQGTNLIVGGFNTTNCSTFFSNYSETLGLPFTNFFTSNGDCIKNGYDNMVECPTIARLIWDIVSGEIYTICTIYNNCPNGSNLLNTTTSYFKLNCIEGSTPSPCNLNLNIQNITVCIGANAYLNVSNIPPGYGTYEIYEGQTFITSRSNSNSTINLNLGSTIISGTYTFTYTLNGCTETLNFTISRENEVDNSSLLPLGPYTNCRGSSIDSILVSFISNIGSLSLSDITILDNSSNLVSTFNSNSFSVVPSGNDLSITFNNSIDLEPLAIGSYTINFTVSNIGCPQQVVIPFSIIDCNPCSPNTLSLSLSGIPDTFCNSQPSISFNATAIVSGGTYPYTYSWTASGATITGGNTNNPTIEYTTSNNCELKTISCLVTDDLGCTISSSDTIDKKVYFVSPNSIVLCDNAVNVTNGNILYSCQNTPITNYNINWIYGTNSFGISSNTMSWNNQITTDFLTAISSTPGSYTVTAEFTSIGNFATGPCSTYTTNLNVIVSDCVNPCIQPSGCFPITLSYYNSVITNATQGCTNLGSTTTLTLCKSFFDSVNNNLGIGINSPSDWTYSLQITSNTTGASLSNSGGNNILTIPYLFLQNNTPGSVTLSVTYNPPVGSSGCSSFTSTYILTLILPIPTFSLPPNICQGGIINLPTISSNYISGTWSGSGVTNNNTFNSTGLSGTTILTFTPNIGQCGSVLSTSIMVNVPSPVIISQLLPTTICSSASPITLQTTQSNINGTWSGTGVSNNNTFTPTGLNGIYTLTFAPNAGQCKSSSTINITVTDLITPEFDDISICKGESFDLPTTSNNGINGTWTPAINNVTTSTYTFTPTPGQCATTATMIVTVNSKINPTFDTFGPYCIGEPGISLPTTSIEGISGSWNIAEVDTSLAGQFNYLFTPDPGECAEIKNITIIVEDCCFDPISVEILGGSTTSIVNNIHSNPSLYDKLLTGLQEGKQLDVYFSTGVQFDKIEIKIDGITYVNSNPISSFTSCGYGVDSQIPQNTNLTNGTGTPYTSADPCPGDQFLLGDQTSYNAPVNYSNLPIVDITKPNSSIGIVDPDVVVKYIIFSTNVFNNTNTPPERSCSPSFYKSNILTTMLTNVNNGIFNNDAFVLFQIPITAALAFKPIQIIVTKDPCSSTSSVKRDSGSGVIVHCRD